ncbi:MAG: hypothetical protein O2860_07815, partial [Chloroflexi bacterium]|nr:hypothetical protein [Chloroflexota bacterium]
LPHITSLVVHNYSAPMVRFLSALDTWLLRNHHPSGRDEVLGLPLCDLSAIYGVNPKIRGFVNEPRFDKHLFANLWWFGP